MQCSFKKLPLLIFIITKLQLQGSGSIWTRLTEELIASSKIEIVFCQCHPNFKVMDFLISSKIQVAVKFVLLDGLATCSTWFHGIPRRSSWAFLELRARVSLWRHRQWPWILSANVALCGPQIPNIPPKEQHNCNFRNAIKNYQVNGGWYQIPREINYTHLQQPRPF